MLTDMEIRGVRDRVLLLRSLETLGGLDLDDYTMLAEHARNRFFRPGEELIGEDQTLHSVYIVIDGKVEVSRGGRSTVVVDRGHGVGFLSLLGRVERGFAARALVASWVLEIPCEAVLDAFEINFALLRNALRQTCMLLVRQRENLPASRASGSEGTGEISLGTYRERDRTVVERIIEARKVPIFRNCNVDAVAELMRKNREIRGPAGQVFWRIGDPSTFWFRIEYGHVECENDAGQTVVVGDRYVLGVADALARQSRSYRARALTEYIGMRSEVETFLTVLEAHFDLAMDFLAVMARQLIDED
ncbi:MAG: cyclic nucleotide-binding domain-containing protein [Proteobacteria bacterium]|nr:cyclic nucleotide-binding domain-containing protein [Pseudomonadota bacterium]